MVLKYRVYEVARDLGVTSKEVLKVLKTYTELEKKHMTALEPSELDIIFDYYTQQNEVKSFDEYFSYIPKVSRRKKVVTEESKKNTAESASEQGSPECRSSKKSKNKKQNQEKRSLSSLKDLKSKFDLTGEESKFGTEYVSKEFKPDYSSDSLKKASIQNDNNSPAFTVQYASLEPSDPYENQFRIDTRSSNIDIEKYNEKYDKLASESSGAESGNFRKQKFTRNSAFRKKFRKGKKETEAQRLKRIELERKQRNLTITVPDEISVTDLARKLKATVSEVLKRLMSMGVTVTSASDNLDFDTASLLALEFNAKVKKENKVSIEELIIDSAEDKEEDLKQRAPVVVVMGHVDHGKTSLLDSIRKANVIASEAGGITQHIGAYRVNINGKDITFLDTPGHEAFTSMRARGAQITDIAILVVAADDGIMPQTIEAIHHAKAAGISIIVAINKMDKEEANPEKVKQQLTEHEIVPEEWGGDVPCVPISAKTGMGIKDLLEMVNLVAEMKELKANPNRDAKGVVVEARLDKGKGPVASLLIQNGTLKVGDVVVAGTSVGRVRSMVNDSGQSIASAGPSVPVKITGLESVPTSGDEFDAVKNEKLAKELVEQRVFNKKEEEFNALTKVTLDNLYDQMALGQIKELKVIVKADVGGSVEAVKESLQRLSNDEVRVNVIHSAAGAITESDVMLASASGAIIVGFNIRPESNAAMNAERLGVDIRLYRVIYDCIEEIEKAMKGMLEPKFKETVLGKAECRHLYKISGVGVVSGSYVTDGKITKNSKVRVIRDGVVVCEDEIASLKRFKDDAKEVMAGYECGIGLSKFNDIKEGDIFESFLIEEVKD